MVGSHFVDRGADQNELGLVFRAGRGERNRVTITIDEFAVTITDLAGVRTSDPNCTRSSATTAVCQTPIEQVPPNLGRARLDRIQRVPEVALRRPLRSVMRSRSRRHSAQPARN